MPTLKIDEATYQGLQARAAASGLTVEAWLRTALGTNWRMDREPKNVPVRELTVKERLDRLRAFGATLRSHGGSIELERHELYD